MKWFVIFLLNLQFAIFSSALAQISDDFSDGNISGNPEWIGNIDQFTINAEDQLQLNAPAQTGISVLSTTSEIINEATWTFDVRLDFNPSSSNYLDVYLVSDQQDFSLPLNGYFVRIGNTADEVSLYRQSGERSSAEKIIDGLDDRIDMGVVEIGIQVTKDATNEWELLVDPGLSGAFISDGVTVDNSHMFSRYFGLLCKYTSTRSTKFYFDNLAISGKVFIDNLAPKVDTLIVESDSSLSVIFSEKIDTVSGTEVSNYFVGNGISNPASIELQNDSTVLLVFKAKFEDGLDNSMTIDGVQDLFGNIMAEETRSILYEAPYIPQHGDIIVTEILADPTPEVDLPENEFLEILNTTDQTINITRLTLIVGKDTTFVPEFSIDKGEYLILCQSSAVLQYSKFGRTIPVKNWPTLNNKGEPVYLLNSNNELIYEVSYADSWYQSSDKKKGGWSLEIIDLSMSFRGFSNWKASEDPSGGTPGKQNSVNGKIEDLVSPTVISISASSDSTIVVLFSEQVIDSTAVNLSNYEISSDIGNPEAIHLENDSLVTLRFERRFQEQTDYKLSISGIKDLFDNQMLDQQLAIEYTAPYLIEYHDLVITEIMADPTPARELPELEYLEIFNRTDQQLSIYGLGLVAGRDTTYLPYFQMEAGEYIILCQSAAVPLLSEYGRTIKVSNWPTLNNTGERLTLFNSENELIFTVDYDDSWYKSIDKEDGGWSLEMIDTDFPCKGNENWKASADERGGTPAQENASAEELTDLSAPDIKKIIAVDQYSVLVYLNEKLGPIDIALSSVKTNPELSISGVELRYPEFDQIMIYVDDEIKPNTEYSVTIENLKDCSGNNQPKTEGRFVLPDAADEFDILINELLFDPLPNGVDFVELYNQSEKYIDLKHWQIANKDTSYIVLDHFLFEPNQHLVLTEDFEILNNQYPGIDRSKVLDVENLPGFNDDEGNVSLLSSEGKLIDRFSYSEDMHSVFVHDAEGVSLERISFADPTNNPDNWQSASESAGFATPGELNSQHFKSAVSDQAVVIEPSVFDPGSSGTDSYTMIRCNFGQPGYMASIKVVDAVGREVKTIASHQSMGVEESFKWEGEDNSGQEVRMGPYLVFLEVYNGDGDVKVYRKKVVVASRF